MKKALVALAIVALASTASAKIAGGSHDLTTAPYSSTSISACQFCHAPHNVNPNSGGAPLWNRNMPAVGTFTVYTSTTLNGGPATPGANSLTCLSCHDGVSDMGNTYTGSKGWATPKTMNTTFKGGGLGSPVVGQNLGDDHPVGVTYSGVGDYVAAPLNGLKLYANKVECGSCHDPHAQSDGLTGSGVDGLQSFLRTAAVNVCASCHIK